ncbi:MAG: hypothetical protein HYT79_05190 [Elusimicrobia bacterium]|nr:hypothetical protein [Elusimicrobiota bacterium]
MSSPAKVIEAQIATKFEKKHVVAAIDHHIAAIEKFQHQDWEGAIVKDGKFIEAIMKAVSLYAGQTLPASRDFKVDKVINDLFAMPRTSLDDTIRLVIPRACRFGYEIASNRGARHDPGEVDPNEMDADVIVVLCSWIMAELVRYSGRGALSLKDASDLVAELMEKKYPLTEEIDRRPYFNIKKISAREVGLLTLWYRHPRRVTVDTLVDTICRHQFSINNAKLAVRRLASVVDDDGNSLRLRALGMEEAEGIIRRAGAPEVRK